LRFLEHNGRAVDEGVGRGAGAGDMCAGEGRHFEFGRMCFGRAFSRVQYI
jgi:hypothetical protein